MSVLQASVIDKEVMIVAMDCWLVLESNQESQGCVFIGRFREAFMACLWLACRAFKSGLLLASGTARIGREWRMLEIKSGCKSAMEACLGNFFESRLIIPVFCFSLVTTFFN